MTDGWFDLGMADERHAVLVATHKSEALSVLLVAGRPVVVGRDPSNDQGPTLRLPDPRISRSHARWQLTPDGLRVVVEDLGSRNGTWVEGKRITRIELAIGDEVRVGEAIFKAQLFGGRAALSCEPEGEGEMVAGKEMQGLIEQVQRLASARMPVVLRGETGSGKEMIAELLHRLGPRRDQPLLKVNCAAVPSSLAEAMFFGHERGAFTGASARRRGIFEEADGGTVLLDEISDLPLTAQGALLRVLDKNSFARVGGIAEISVDVRVVAATHHDLAALVRSRQLRADLYHRLSAVELELPPLRERRPDVPLLARRFLRAANALNGRRVLGFDAETLRVLEAYPWPGNVRELKHAVERAVVLTTHEQLLPDDFPRQQFAFIARHGNITLESEPASPPPTTSPPADEAGSSDEAPSSQGDPPGEGGPGSLPDRLRTLEAAMIRDALLATSWNRVEAAERLGIPLRTLARKITALGIQKLYRA